MALFEHVGRRLEALRRSHQGLLDDGRIRFESIVDSTETGNDIQEQTMNMRRHTSAIVLHLQQQRAMRHLYQT